MPRWFEVSPVSPSECVECLPRASALDVDLVATQPAIGAAVKPGPFYVSEGLVQDERLVLEQELTNVVEQIARLEKALDVQPDYGIGEGDPAVTRWEVNRALLERLQEHKTSLERALLRSNSGLYGVCTKCGQEINPDRLAVLPDTRLCIRCAQATERVPVR